jgi:hypothetical protein
MNDSRSRRIRNRVGGLFELCGILLHLFPHFRHSVANSQRRIFDRPAIRIRNANAQICESVVDEIIELRCCPRLKSDCDSAPCIDGRGVRILFAPEPIGFPVFRSDADRDGIFRPEGHGS